MYGYKRGEEKNKLVIDPYAAEIVKEIFCMKMEGMSNQAIADELNSLGVLSPAEYKKEQGSGYKAIYPFCFRSRYSMYRASDRSGRICGPCCIRSLRSRGNGKV